MAVKASLILRLVGVVAMAVPVYSQVAASSYSHWCPAIEMKRVNCVVRTPASQAHSLARNDRLGNEPSTLRRVYRWKKQFVLRCCPGFMGNNCQQACFSCRGYAQLNKRLDNIERMVQQTYNGGRQTPDPDTQRRREELERLRLQRQRYPTTAGYDKTQYPSRRRADRLSPSGERRVLAQMREAGTSSRTFQRPLVVQSPPEMVVSLGGDSHNSQSGNPATLDHNDAPQRDQDTDPSARDPRSRSSGASSTSGKHASQSEDSKHEAWTGEQIVDLSGEDISGFTNVPTAEVENVWKHWDEAFQARLSTLERQVLELETKVSALGPALSGMVSVVSHIGQLANRIEAVEIYTGIPNVQNKPRPDGDKLKDKSPSMGGNPAMLPANLSYNTKMSKVKGHTTKDNSSSTTSSPKKVVPSSKGHPNAMTSSNSSSPCPRSCQGQRFPSRPPPPPLPDQETLERIFTNASKLIGALREGNKQFYEHLKTVLRKNSTDQESSSALDDSTLGRNGDDYNVFGGQGQPLGIKDGDSTSGSSKRGAGHDTNVRVQGRERIGEDGLGARSGSENKIGQAMARQSSRGFKPSTSCVLLGLGIVVAGLLRR